MFKFKTFLFTVTLLAAFGLMTLLFSANPKKVKKNPKPLKEPTTEDIQQMTDAMPAKPTAPVKKNRKILVFYRCEGFKHGSIPFVNKAIEIMGKKTGAFETVLSDDMAVFTKDNLKKFDAVLLNNTTKLKFDDPEKRNALLDFIKNGKGIIGVHAATDNFYDWPEAAAMMGGLFNGHPWGAGSTVKIKLDEPGHPLNKAFNGQSFTIKDEIYQLKDFSRENVRVLMSLDMNDPQTRDMKSDKQKREDKDYAISYIRKYGNGLMFYCSLGHNIEVFLNKAVLQHYLDGIQFALGDLIINDSLAVPVKK